MGIVRKILGEEETLKKEDLKAMKGEIEDETPAPSKEEEKVVEEMIPSGIEMFVRVNDYKSIVSNLKRLEGIIDRIEELERMHSEIHDMQSKFSEEMENVLSEIEEIKEELGEKLGARL